MHLEAPHIWTGVILEGAAEMMIKGYAMGNNWSGYYTSSLQEAFARGWRSRPDDVSETVKLVLLLGEYMHRNYHNRYHAKAQNLRVLLRAAYDEALRHCDILAMPTIPFPATEIPPAECAARSLCRSRAQHAAEHLSLRCERPSGIHRALRQGQRPACRHDAGRTALRGDDPDPGGAGARAGGRLADPLNEVRLIPAACRLTKAAQT